MAEKNHGGDSPPPLLPLPLPVAGEMKKRKLFVFEELEEGEIVPSGEDEDDNDDDDGKDDDDEAEVNVKTIGNVVRVSGTEDSRKFHFIGFEANGFSYRLEDTVLVVPKELDTEEFDFTTKPSVVTIKDISATQGKVTVTGQMFYRPEIAENQNGENWKTGESRELFFSFDKTEFPAEAVMHKCRVHYVPPNKEIPSAKEYPGFVVKKVYDSKYKELNELTDSGYEERKRHEIKFLLQKTIAQIPQLAITDQIMN